MRAIPALLTFSNQSPMYIPERGILGSAAAIRLSTQSLDAFLHPQVQEVVVSGTAHSATAAETNLYMPYHGDLNPLLRPVQPIEEQCCMAWGQRHTCLAEANTLQHYLCNKRRRQRGREIYLTYLLGAAKCSSWSAMKQPWEAGNFLVMIWEEQYSRIWLIYLDRPKFCQIRWSLFIVHNFMHDWRLIQALWNIKQRINSWAKEPKGKTMNSKLHQLVNPSMDVLFYLLCTLIRHGLSFYQS